MNPPQFRQLGEGGPALEVKFIMAMPKDHEN